MRNQTARVHVNKCDQSCMLMLDGSTPIDKVFVASVRIIQYYEHNIIGLFVAGNRAFWSQVVWKLFFIEFHISDPVDEHSEPL